MNLTVTRIALIPSSPPADLFARRYPGEVWHIATAPIGEDAVNWSICRTAPLVTIPMHPYITSQNVFDVFGFGIQLGVKITQQFVGKSIGELRIALGAPVISSVCDGKPVWQHWVGVAVVLQ